MGGQKISRSNPGWRKEFEETLPDLREEDIFGSGFAITGYTVHRDLGGDAALARLRERLRQRGLRLMLDFVPTTPAWITPAFDAMKDIPEGERAVCVRTRRPVSGAIQIEVNDRGTGISPDRLARLFEPFQTTKPEGLGLGLSISRSIVEAHGGQLWVTNNADRGATFCFTLPTVDGEQAARVQGSGFRKNEDGVAEERQ